jgi:ubiquinone/menaquinone biosynthesis C-methylase UbiE
MDNYYKSRFTFDSSREVVRKEIIKFLTKYIPSGATVVDLGAGYCDFINNVKTKRRYAVDTSPELKKYAGENVEIINKTAWDLSGISSDSVDIVHASNLFEHFTDEELEKTMAEIKRILKKGGKLILMQPNYRLTYKNYFDDPTHKKVFSDKGMESFLIFHDMKIILKMPRFLPFSMKSKPPVPTGVLPFLVYLYIHSPIKPLAGQMLFVAEK